MYATIVTFHDNIANENHEGVAFYFDEFDTVPAYVVCGCCGGVYKSSEVTILDERGWHSIEDSLANWAQMLS